MKKNLTAYSFLFLTGTIQRTGHTEFARPLVLFLSHQFYVGNKKRIKLNYLLFGALFNIIHISTLRNGNETYLYNNTTCVTSSVYFLAMQFGLKKGYLYSVYAKIMSQTLYKRER